jgi:hypothetical protein
MSIGAASTTAHIGAYTAPKEGFKMYKLFSELRLWLARLFETDGGEVGNDPLSAMSARELADLPVHHPRFDGCMGA